MAGANPNILDQIAKFFIVLFDAPFYWFTINASCDHAFHLSKWLSMDELDYKVLLIAGSFISEGAAVPLPPLMDSTAAAATSSTNCCPLTTLL
jgi:hypothetical protein